MKWPAVIATAAAAGMFAELAVSATSLTYYDHAL